MLPAVGKIEFDALSRRNFTQSCDLSVEGSMSRTLQSPAAVLVGVCLPESLLCGPRGMFDRDPHISAAWTSAYSWPNAILRPRQLHFLKREDGVSVCGSGAHFSRDPDRLDQLLLRRRFPCLSAALVWPLMQ